MAARTHILSLELRALMPATRNVSVWAPQSIVRAESQDAFPRAFDTSLRDGSVLLNLFSKARCYAPQPEVYEKDHEETENRQPHQRRPLERAHLARGGGPLFLEPAHTWNVPEAPHPPRRGPPRVRPPSPGL